jgi:hypothetical protein
VHVCHLCGIAVEHRRRAAAQSSRGCLDRSQVEERRTTALEAEQVLDEWALRVDTVAATLDARTMPVPPAADVLTHESDIAEALGDPTPPEEGWRDAARQLCRSMIRATLSS